MRGKPHAAGHSTGTVREIGTTAYGVQFDGTTKIHRWYVARELERIHEENPGIDELILLGALGAVSQAPKASAYYQMLSPNAGLPDGVAKRKGLVASDFSRRDLERGTSHELEHTTSRSIARQIAMDHLAEDPRYYQKLARLERR